MLPFCLSLCVCVPVHMCNSFMPMTRHNAKNLNHNGSVIIAMGYLYVSKLVWAFLFNIMPSHHYNNDEDDNKDVFIKIGINMGKLTQ